MPSHSAIDPYVGPQPFRRTDSKRFFGREESTDELFSLVSGIARGHSLCSVRCWEVIDCQRRPLPTTRKKRLRRPAYRKGSGLASRWEDRSPAWEPLCYFTLASWGEQAPDTAAEGALSAALAHLPRATDRYGDPAYRLLIFDQFEELFTSFPACWAQRSRFAAELVRCVADDERLRILFVVREDHLADVLSLAEAFPRLSGRRCGSPC